MLPAAGENMPGCNTIQMFRIDRSKISVRKLKLLFQTIWKKLPFAKGYEFFYQTFPNKLACEGDPIVFRDEICELIEKLSPKTIKIGICSAACGKIAYRVLGAMIKLQNMDKRKHKSTINEVQKECKQWSLFNRMYVLENYLQAHHLTETHIRRALPDVDVGMIRDVWQKNKRLHSKHLKLLGYVHYKLSDRLSRLIR